MHMVYMVAMKKGELKDEITKLLMERGPMTSAQIAAELGAELRDVIGAMKAMSIEGRAYVLKRDRKKGNIWAVPGWLR